MSSNYPPGVSGRASDFGVYSAICPICQMICVASGYQELGGLFFDDEIRLCQHDEVVEAVWELTMRYTKCKVCGGVATHTGEVSSGRFAGMETFLHEFRCPAGHLTTVEEL